MFITFEGAEGGGKTTQAKLLKEYLEANGKKVVLTREPGGTELAEKLRSILLNDKEIKDSVTELLIVTAGRRDHLENFIKPHLKEGFIVICDRFIDSSFAYQGFGKGLDFTTIQTIHQIALGDFKPDITILIDIESEMAIERIKKGRAGNNHYDYKGLEFHKKIRNGFLKLAESNQDRFYVINGNEDIDVIHKKVLSYIVIK